MQQAHPPSQVWVEALAQLLEGLGTATFAASDDVLVMTVVAEDQAGLEALVDYIQSIWQP